MKRLRFVYARFRRHADVHPELRDAVPCDEYFGPPSLGIACLAAVTPAEWEIELRDDRVEDVGLDDPPDVVAISCFTPAGVRAMELADRFRAAGSLVILGGLFPTARPDEAGLHCDAVVVGEGEAIWPEVLRDAARGELRPRYRAAASVDLAELPLPRVDLYVAKERDGYRPDDYPVQLSRGCMLSCSACVLPLSMGRKVRRHDAEHVRGQIAQLERAGKLASLTEDTSFFPGSPQQRALSELLDHAIERGEELGVSYVGISMPMILAQSPQLFARLRAGGIRMFYLVGGFDPITRGAFTGRDPKNRQRAVDALRRCEDEGIEPYVSFLVGNDADDEGTFDRMLEFTSEVALAKAEFAIRTPYPGTPDFDALSSSGRILHTDWSRYNDANVVFRPARMSPESLLQGYLDLWRGFYRSRRSLATLDHRERTIQF